MSAGLLSLEEFRLLSNDAFQRFLLQQGVKRSQLVRNSRHTWLYQGRGAHRVLQDLKARSGTAIFFVFRGSAYENTTPSFSTKGDSPHPTPTHPGGPQ